MSGPHPDVAAARAAVRESVADLPDGSLVLVACSGGADSMALAAATGFVASRRRLHAGAMAVDHGMQPGSAAVVADAVAACRRLGLDPAWSESVTVSGRGGPEAAARDARYDALEEAARRTGAACVLLGHTLDDQAETVLLALARGSGARSLAGMPAVRGLFRRPLLRLRRSQTASVCAALGLTPWSDPTNADPRANRRAAVRHEVVPALTRALGGGVVPALARTADLLRADADLLDELAADLLAAATLGGALHEDGDGPLELDTDVLEAAAPALRGRALRAAAVGAGAPAGAIGSSHVEALTALVAAWRGQGPVHLPGGVVAGRRCGRLSLRKIGTPTASGSATGSASAPEMRQEGRGRDGHGSGPRPGAADRGADPQPAR